MSRMDQLVAECLFRIAKRRVAARRAGPGGSESRTVEAYSEWRHQSLEAQFTEFFDPELVKGKDVLDFGCGSGALTLMMTRLGAREVCGIDLSTNEIAKAVAAAKANGIAAEFRVADRTDSIELPDDSWDVILCFDALEHIMEYENIIPEWKRVLRLDGKILILWSPYFHPYGHHVHTYAPIPWIHLVVSDKVINMVCSKMVNLPEFEVPYWDLDQYGNRKDRFAGSSTIGHLNHLTIAKFERLCHSTGFHILRREYRTFHFFKRWPLVQKVVSLPVLREYLTSFVAYELVVRA
jgi:SAM-dependent methyltransferase